MKAKVTKACFLIITFLLTTYSWAVGICPQVSQISNSADGLERATSIGPDGQVLNWQSAVVNSNLPTTFQFAAIGFAESQDVGCIYDTVGMMIVGDPTGAWPIGNNWSYGYCNSNNPANCPFYI